VSVSFAEHGVMAPATACWLCFLPWNHPTAASLQRLKHEYELKDQLEVAWALKPLELVRARQQTMLVLDFPGGEPLQRLVGRPMEVGRFLRLALAYRGRWAGYTNGVSSTKISSRPTSW